MNIVLTGFMGTGKSVAGKQLAQRLRFLFYDTDEIIEKEVGMTVPEIFSRKGESFFRNTETEAIKLVSVLDNLVIAVGGGAVLREENIRELKRNGIIFCLTATPEVIWERVGKSNYRPLLNKKDPRKEIKKLLKEREPFYQNCDFSIDTSNLTPEDIVEKIIGLVPELKSSERK